MEGHVTGVNWPVVSVHGCYLYVQLLAPTMVAGEDTQR